MSSTTKVALSRLGAHILGWLICHNNGGTAHEITKVLRALVEDRGSEAEQRRLVDEDLAVFTQAGFVTRVRKAAFILTPSGHRAALGAIRWKELLAKSTWRDVKKRLEAFTGEPKTLLEKEPVVDEDGGISSEKATALLASAFQLTVGPAPTLPQLVNALAWHAIGVKKSEPFTAPAAIRVLLDRLDGASKKLPLEQAIAVIAAKAATPAPPEPAPPKEPPATIPLPADDNALARRVLAAARASKTGHFGDDKVFISHVLRQLAAEGSAVGDAKAFKDRLVSLHRRGLLSLSRADLVEAMDPKDVETSETRHLSATFHFVRV